MPGLIQLLKTEKDPAIVDAIQTRLLDQLEGDKKVKDAEGKEIKIGDVLVALETMHYMMGQDTESDMIPEGDVVTVDYIDADHTELFTDRSIPALGFEEHADRYGPWPAANFRHATVNEIKELGDNKKYWTEVHTRTAELVELAVADLEKYKEEFNKITNEDLRSNLLIYTSWKYRVRGGEIKPLAEFYLAHELPEVRARGAQLYDDDLKNINRLIEHLKTETDAGVANSIQERIQYAMGLVPEYDDEDEDEDDIEASQAVEKDEDFYLKSPQWQCFMLRLF